MMAGEEMERAVVLGLLLGRPKRRGEREKTDRSACGVWV